MTHVARPAATRLAVTRDGVEIPALAWMPDSPRATVVVGHGGSGHKASTAVLGIVDACVARGMAALAIDGPVHGERRSDGSLDPRLAKDDFRAAWRAGVGHVSMADDLSAALDALQRTSVLAAVPVAYVGFSMGTAYGIPFVALDDRVRAAALGLWGSNYPASDHLVDFARRIRCPTCFVQQWDDATFDRAGTHRLFDAIGTPAKKLVAYPGDHREPTGERLDDAVRFVAASLGLDDD